MQVELCEIPPCGGPRKTEEWGVLGSTPQRRRMRETQQMGVFQQPVKDLAIGNRHCWWIVWPGRWAWIEKTLPLCWAAPGFRNVYVKQYRGRFRIWFQERVPPVSKHGPKINFRKCKYFDSPPQKEIHHGRTVGEVSGSVGSSLPTNYKVPKFLGLGPCVYCLLKFSYCCQENERHK